GSPRWRVLGCRASRVPGCGRCQLRRRNGKSSVLERGAAKLMSRARKLSRRSGQTEHEYGSMRYKARTWPRQRRVIIKAEVTCLEGRDPRDNPRFVVTN